MNSIWTKDVSLSLSTAIFSVNRGSGEENPRTGTSKDRIFFRISEGYITQVSEENEGKMATQDPPRT